ncbi:hypothetical protein FN846DRAFT_938188 [Sphaerosporella brunnea]|uniref:Uncharacterized protein n=1 Tax=Sphaerosporella brunnea TaxID=1250544 RepID=A0A5J5F3F3_9PEZI|nr:hypothetical protein FN846DRAFT_938188 [Sphaerosporella brunnea]
MTSQNEHRIDVCCFGFVEAYEDVDGKNNHNNSNHARPARAPRQTTVMVERSSIPRSAYVSALPPAQEYHPTTTYISASGAPAAAAAAAAAADDTASRIAELLAPLALESREAEEAAEAAAAQAAERRMARDRTTVAAIQKQYIEAEAIRRVRERNERADRRAAELRSLENDARLRIENDFRSSSTSSIRSRGSDYNAASTDRLVVVEQSVARTAGDRNTHRCSKCHVLGHRSRDCSAVITVGVSRSGERRRSVSYHRVEPPRGQVRYVRGA